METHYVDLSQPKTYPSVGECIYCRKTLLTTNHLGREHLVPESLAGNALLLKASCRDCETLTSQIERFISKSMLDILRARTGIAGKKRKGKVQNKTFPIYRTLCTPAWRLGRIAMADKQTPSTTLTSFEALKRLNEHTAEYWSTRDLQPLLGYSQWRRFGDAISRAMTSCEQSGNKAGHHSAGAGKMVGLGSGSAREVDNSTSLLRLLSDRAERRPSQTGDRAGSEIFRGPDAAAGIVGPARRRCRAAGIAQTDGRGVQGAFGRGAPGGRRKPDVRRVP